MLRRRVLALGLAGWSAALVGGCGKDDSSATDTAQAAGEGASTAPTYDPSTYVPPEIDVSELRALYTYDQSETLNALGNDVQVEDGLRIEDLTYTGVGDAHIPTYAIAPYEDKGAVPGIVFALDAGTTRDAVLAEAKALASIGAVAVIPEIDFQPTGDPQGDSTLIINAVIAQRRALDLLARRDDVNSNKLAIVGHGWGGALAQILAGIDTRFVAVVSAGASGRWSREAYRTALPADYTTYLDSLTRFDGARYVAISGKRSVMLQFGAEDSSVSTAEADELAAATVGTNERHDYEGDPDWTSLTQAVADRETFLSTVLKLG